MKLAETSQPLWRLLAICSQNTIQKLMLLASAFVPLKRDYGRQANICVCQYRLITLNLYQKSTLFLASVFYKGKISKKPSKFPY